MAQTEKQPDVDHVLVLVVEARHLDSADGSDEARAHSPAEKENKISQSSLSELNLWSSAERRGSQGVGNVQLTSA